MTSTPQVIPSSVAPGLGESESPAENASKRTHEEEPLTATGRAKQRKQDLLVVEARHVGRTLDAFVTPGAMFNFGLESIITSTSAETSLEEGVTKEQLRYFKIYKYLCTKIPHFEARVVDVSNETFREHEKLFRTGLSAARSDDIATLKAVVIDWVSAPPFNAATTTHPLARNSKATRGFNNPVIGELLCPTDLDWQTVAVQCGLRDGTIEVLPSQWPNFIYDDGVPQDGDDMWVGAFRHPLLVKTLKHIYTSPSSVEGADGSRATRSSKAALAGMTGVTVGAIADAVVKLRHSLSSNATFQKNDKASHNELFYYGLLEVLEAEQFQEHVQELLHWYDRQLFFGQEAATAPPPNSALARMRAQLGIAAAGP